MEFIKKHKKGTLITILIIALFIISERDKFFTPICIESGCNQEAMEGSKYCMRHYILYGGDSDDDKDDTDDYDSNNYDNNYTTEHDYFIENYNKKRQ